MKPARFQYFRAASADEAVAILHEWDEEARILAGGQSLVPLLNMRLMRPGALVDVNDIHDLARVEERNGDLAIGALVRHATLERSETVRRRVPLLASAVRYIGDRQVRIRGTIGGSLAHADPTGELPVAVLALGGVLAVQGPGGTRELAADEFFLGPYTTALEPDEMIVGVRVPAPPGPVGAFAEFARRHGDFAILSAAVACGRGADGAVQSLRLALGGVADRPILVEEASERLIGTTLDADAIAAACAAAVRAADPSDDIRASAEYRRHLIPIYVERVLSELRLATEGGA
jgi:carbon-monoxide dehydrogenase medium subunit